MRQIKFRAWDKENKMMSINPVASVQNTDWDVELNSVFEQPNYTFMQYTGLLDKNGKEIYEGDVVKNKKYGNGLVSWENGVGFGCEYKEICLGTGVWHTDSLEVIGNIYENPELLK